MTGNPHPLRLRSAATADLTTRDDKRRQDDQTARRPVAHKKLFHPASLLCLIPTTTTWDFLSRSHKPASCNSRGLTAAPPETGYFFPSSAVRPPPKDLRCTQDRKQWLPQPHTTPPTRLCTSTVLGRPCGRDLASGRSCSGIRPSLCYGKLL